MLQPEATNAGDEPAGGTGDDPADRFRRLTAGLKELTELVRGLGPPPPGPDRGRLYVALNDFMHATRAALFPPRRPRKPRGRRSSITDGWVGG